MAKVGKGGDGSNTNTETCKICSCEKGCEVKLPGPETTCDGGPNMAGDAGKVSRGWAE